MKKLVKTSAGIVLSAGLLAACGGNNEDAPTNENNGSGENGNENGGNETLVIGASNVPHAEILEFAQPLLEEEGVELEIREFTDYVLPNEALAEGEIDANYFQHVPYLEGQIEEHGYDFVNAGGVHIEPIGIYSQDYSSLDELPDGATVLMSDSVADHGRILMMLEEEGLITLAEGAGIGASLDDIEENPRDLNFQANIEAALLPTAYQNNEGDAVLINSNYALDHDLNPLQDAIATEEASEENPYVNVIAVRSEDEGDERVEKLLEVLRSQEVRDYILETYENSVVPVSE